MEIKTTMNKKTFLIWLFTLYIVLLIIIVANFGYSEQLSEKVVYSYNMNPSEYGSYIHLFTGYYSMISTYFYDGSGDVDIMDFGDEVYPSDGLIGGGTFFDVTNYAIPYGSIFFKRTGDLRQEPEFYSNTILNGDFSFTGWYLQNDSRHCLNIYASTHPRCGYLLSDQEVAGDYNTQAYHLVIQVTNTTFNVYTNGDDGQLNLSYFTNGTHIGNWTMFSVTFNNATKEGNLYFNNHLVDTGNLSGYTGADEFSLDIGEPYDFVVPSSGAIQNALWGYVDIFNIWNWTLTEQEISYLYNDGDGIEYPFTRNGKAVITSDSIGDDKNNDFIINIEDYIVDEVFNKTVFVFSLNPDKSFIYDYSFDSTEIDHACWKEGNVNSSWDVCYSDSISYSAICKINCTNKKWDYILNVSSTAFAYDPTIFLLIADNSSGISYKTSKKLIFSEINQDDLSAVQFLPLLSAGMMIILLLMATSFIVSFISLIVVILVILVYYKRKRAKKKQTLKRIEREDY